MIIGIDPGAHGAMALLHDDGTVANVFTFAAKTEKDTALEMGMWFTRFPGTRVFIERVGYIKGDGAGGSFTFGKIYGFLKGAAMAYSHGAVHEVYPMAWQSTMECLSGGNKNVTKNRAKELFKRYDAARPRGITHDIADALLIAEYGRRKIKEFLN